MGYAVLRKAVDDPESVLVKIFNTRSEAEAEKKKLEANFDWVVTIDRTSAKTSRTYFHNIYSNQPKNYWR